MLITWDELIARARTYVDDDHKDETSWILPERWMTLFQVEYRKLYRQWVRAGLVAPAPVDTTFTGSTVTISEVLTIIGVAEVTGDSLRVLQSAQSLLGARPFWTGASDVGKSSQWGATGAANTITVTLHPADSSGSYLVRYLTRPVYATDSTATVDLPDGGDERLVLGAARRAHLKDSAASRLLDALLLESDADLNFAAFSAINGDSPRVRRVGRPNPYMPYQAAVGFVNDPRTYRYY